MLGGSWYIVKLTIDTQPHLNEFFEEYRVPNISSPTIQTYVEKRLAENAANSTINRELSALKRMLNLSARQTPPKVDLVPYIPLLREHNTRKGFFEHDEFLVLRDALPSYLKGFVTFAYKEWAGDFPKSVD